MGRQLESVINMMRIHTMFGRSKFIIRKRYDQPCREVGPHDFSLLCDMALQNDVFLGKSIMISFHLHKSQIFPPSP